ncbi:hypothetical protein ACL90Y_08700 [Micrococcus luteus]
MIRTLFWAPRPVSWVNTACPFAAAADHPDHPARHHRVPEVAEPADGRVVVVGAAVRFGRVREHVQGLVLVVGTVQDEAPAQAQDVSESASRV